MTKDLSLILKETRVRLGLTTKQLSKLSGVNENLIKGYENGNYNPSIWKLQKVCKSLKLSMDDALEGREYDYAQVKNPLNGYYTLLNKTRGIVVKKGERKIPYPFVKIVDSHDRKSVGTIIKETRIRLGYSQVKLAEKTSYSAPTIHYIETKRKIAKGEGFCAVIKVLNLSLKDILKGVEYEYVQIRNPKDGCYTLINKTKGLILEQGKRNKPYPFVKIVEEKDLEV